MSAAPDTSPDRQIELPIALLAELTHRCPLRCAYCSNPLDLERSSQELTTEDWKSVITQAADLGVLQLHFSGGEPTIRKDLEDLIRHGRAAGLYTNLITAGVLLDEARVAALAAAGLDHVQIAFQDIEEDKAALIAGYDGGVAQKRQAAALVRQAGLALTINAVITRHNVERVDQLIALAVELGAGRVEIANVQYYGWGLQNRAALIPSMAQMLAMTEVVTAARERLKGVITIDYVIPDYYARRPKACVGGWARRFMNVNPAGRVLPCHAAETIPGLVFDSVRDRSLADIWTHGQAFQRYRGENGLPKACKDCDRREIDWGGCRCQALALTGDAGEMDPTCELSPRNAEIRRMAEAEAKAASTEIQYRSFSFTGM